ARLDQRTDLRRGPTHAVWRRQELRQRISRTWHRGARRLLRVEDGRRQPRPREGVMTARKRRICFPLTSRAYYGRAQLLIRKLHDHPDVDLQLMLGGSILLDKYSHHIAEDIERNGFAISTSYFNVIEGGNHVAMAKTACLTALEFTNGFHSI